MNHKENPLDSMAQEHSMNQTVFQNYQGVYITQVLVITTPPLYETRTFNTP